MEETHKGRLADIALIFMTILGARKQKNFSKASQGSLYKKQQIKIMSMSRNSHNPDIQPDEGVKRQQRNRTRTMERIA